MCGSVLWGRSKLYYGVITKTSLSLAYRVRGRSKIMVRGKVLHKLLSHVYLITYLLEEFQASVCRASCKVEAISGNNSCKVLFSLVH